MYQFWFLYDSGIGDKLEGNYGHVYFWVRSKTYYHHIFWSLIIFKKLHWDSPCTISQKNYINNEKFLDHVRALNVAIDKSSMSCKNIFLIFFRHICRLF